MADVWTLQSLKEHIDQRFEDEQRAIELAAGATDTKIDALTDKVSGLQEWQWKIVGAVAICAFALPLITGIVVYILTRK